MDPIHPLSNAMLLGLKALQLNVVDHSRRLITRATGFVVNDEDGLFLYTCWHVVTGIDFHNPHPLTPPTKREFIHLNSQDAVQRTPQVRAIGGQKTIEIPLYNGNGKPVWQQEPHARVQPDLESLGIHVPKSFDLVRIPCTLDPEVRSIVEFADGDVFKNLTGAGTDVVIFGYPYGFSAMDDAPEPIFLKRAIASNRTSDIAFTYLDGGGTPGMSGAPAAIFEGGRWWLVGMYSGIIFPDYNPETRVEKNDRFAALGTMIPFHIARVFLNVPGINKR